MKLKIFYDKVKPRVNRRVFFCIVVIASFFSYIGLSLPFFAASMFPANRLTISQIGVFGNVIFTLASVFCIDKVIAFLSDSMSFRLCDYGSLFLKGRVTSVLLCIIFYVLLNYAL